jgi:hypothetical protein
LTSCKFFKYGEFSIKDLGGSWLFEQLSSLWQETCIWLYALHSNKSKLNASNTQQKKATEINITQITQLCINQTNQQQWRVGQTLPPRDRRRPRPSSKTVATSSPATLAARWLPGTELCALNPGTTPESYALH